MSTDHAPRGTLAEIEADLYTFGVKCGTNIPAAVRGIAEEWRRMKDADKPPYYLRLVLRDVLDLRPGVDPTDAEIIAEAKAVSKRADDAKIALADAHAALDAMPASSAPDCDTPARRIRYATHAWLDERREASNLAQLCQDAHDALTAFGVLNEGTPADRIRMLVRERDAARWSDTTDLELHLLRDALELDARTPDLTVIQKAVDRVMDGPPKPPRKPRKAGPSMGHPSAAVAKAIAENWIREAVAALGVTDAGR